MTTTPKRTPTPKRETRGWPADSVRRWPIDRLIPSARNARTHTDTQVAQIAGSIREWGWTMPVLVDEAGGLIAGHGRVLAGRLLGLSEVPVMVAKGWTEGQKRAYMIADNKLTLNGQWNEELLAVELSDLQEMGFDMALVGFSTEELGVIINGWDSDLKFDETDPDRPGFAIKVTGDDNTEKAKVVDTIKAALVGFPGVKIE
ncbi:ParB/Srx family N-terminal domain-containing protein [Paraburkholderia adhaesiva]|uniref:ParB/Srx family N-terminal domain-containing protein n=1 Tax=Paraburkholderia adhaesiva TaxID=2883244 RepID=UPI001F23147C|nr:ParB/Srx family N-terminal domain-containing protein [Paraburkholderia adhaesiva]